VLEPGWFALAVFKNVNKNTNIKNKRAILLFNHGR
jgi:hypothetical protein